MQLPNAVERPLYYVNTVAIFWFLAFIVVGPKYTIGSSLLLLLGLITLPFNLLPARATLKEQAPWIIGLSLLQKARCMGDFLRREAKAEGAGGHFWHDAVTKPNIITPAP
jgi:hypothetical protein